MRYCVPIQASDENVDYQLPNDHCRFFLEATHCSDARIKTSVAILKTDKIQVEL